MFQVDSHTGLQSCSISNVAVVQVEHLTLFKGEIHIWETRMHTIPPYVIKKTTNVRNNSERDPQGYLM